MFKTLKILLAGILAAVIVVAIGASVYTAFASPGMETPILSDSNQYGYGNGNGGNTGGDGTGISVTAIPPSDLSAEEAAGLLYMREEEKLARDVYNTLFTTWGVQTFQNIASSEQMHMDEIKTLLDRYALTDPALAPGQFTDPALQALYNQLIAQGSFSIGDALKVGGAVEEIDILDLQSRLTQTDNADIQLVYTNLMKGSYNHLQAFAGALPAQTGETYQPQYLPADLYQTIIGDSNGYGGRGTAGGQGGNGNPAGNGNGGGGNANGGSRFDGSGLPQVQAQANLAGATIVHGTVVSYDLTGLSLTLDDGQALYVQLGNSRYSQAIGFAPQIGEGLTVNGFPGDQGLYSAGTITLDSTGQTFSFRDGNGRPLWAGGNGKGNGGRP